MTTISAVPRGTGFARFAKALACARGDLRSAHAYSEGQSWRDTPQVAATLKAAVAAGSTSDPAWAGSLAPLTDMASEFVDVLRPMTILGRLIGTRPVVPNVRFVSALTGTSVSWTGGGYPTPPSEMALSMVTIGIAKAAGLVVLTKELAESSHPAADGMVRNDLLAAMAAFLDKQLLDPAVAAVIDVSPASVTHNLIPITSSGSTVSAIVADFAALFAVPVAAGITFTAPYLVMHPVTALGLSMKRGSDGLTAFPSVTVKGGTLFGIPVLVSASVPTSVSGGSIIVFIDAAEIQSVEGTVLIDASEEASLQMRTDPLSGATLLVSLFQNHLVGLRITSFANWRARRLGAVAYIDGCQY